MLTKVTYVTLFVKDQDNALDFYANTLGFEKRVDNPGAPGGGRFLTVGLKGQDIQIVLWPGTPGKANQSPGPIPGACIIETNDCRKDFEDLKARGINFETPQVLEQPWAFIAILQDPDGNRLMLRENRQPAAQR
jgi:catechol 2,3-dioxygenase-like lactoylglutathione lyase family enzyme